MLKVIGAGLPRTATMSQSQAFPILLGQKCYHMREVLEHPEHIDTWIDALNGELPDWDSFLAGYTAAVDWPASAFWADLAEAYPDALILLSTRDDAATWFRSMSSTVLAGIELSRKGALPGRADPDRFIEMADLMWKRFVGPDSEVTTSDAAGAERAYEDYLQHVRDTAPADRLLEWNAAEGWEPLCERLGLDVPKEPFPHVNTTADFQKMVEAGKVQ